MRAIKKSKGFSLIELMIALGIIGILTAIGVPSYQEYLKKGRASIAKGDLVNLAAKVENYKQGALTYTGVTAAGVYSAGSPADADVPHFNLSVTTANAGRSYMASASANPASSEAVDDGTYWFNPRGKNCYFKAAGAAYSATCDGGEEWK